MRRRIFQVVSGHEGEADSIPNRVSEILPRRPGPTLLTLRIRDTPIILLPKENYLSIRKRIAKYRRSGGAADLVRVEVLVPASARDDVLRLAERLRADHRRDKEFQSEKLQAKRLQVETLEAMCDHALSLYGIRILDNVDLDRLPDARARARVIARSMMERGDARAFALGRKLLAQAEPL
jgi:hypothetical protein